ncbi:cbb3-type cytochrome c oxidase N-terminal domain-containing protein [Dokdonia sp. LLG6352-1]|uniref:cbb3-type cytochrome c oxidase N-terminal domain-containing protein n=1 Tax=Dokdonia sp. LLG6352-1 TaxID=3160831 RepID=UPI00386E309B
MRTVASFLRILGFSILGYFIIDIAGSTGDISIFLQEPWIWAVLGVIILFYTAGEISIEALRSILYKSLKPDAQKVYDKEAALAKKNQFKWFKEKYKASLGSKAVEDEHEIILDHNYDGIKELDNNLPPWWVYMFYATIVFAVIYLVRFEVFNDYDQEEEYQVAVAEAKAEIEEWKKTAKDLVDINTVTLLTDASDINAGKAIFTNNCIACHKADGGGGIGPNLTDQHWILGGGIKNVFKTISEGGRDGKGMISWKSELKPAEMAQVASFVLSLQGTTPAEPKQAEGEIWIDPDAAPTPVKEVDSLVVEEITVAVSN